MVCIHCGKGQYNTRYEHRPGKIFVRRMMRCPECGYWERELVNPSEIPVQELN